MSDSPARIRIRNRNRLNQTWVTGATVADDNPARRAGGTLKMSAAATRAVSTYGPDERAAITTAAASVAASDDRAIRGMVWDCHVAVASGDVAPIRPGVGADADVAAWRSARGLARPAVASPAAR